MELAEAKATSRVEDEDIRAGSKQPAIFALKYAWLSRCPAGRESRADVNCISLVRARNGGVRHLCVCECVCKCKSMEKTKRRADGAEAEVRTQVLCRGTFHPKSLGTYLILSCRYVPRYLVPCQSLGRAGQGPFSSLLLVEVQVRCTGLTAIQCHLHRKRIPRSSIRGSWETWSPPLSPVPSR